MAETGAISAIFRSERWRRVAAELALLTAAGLFIGALGPFGTANVPVAARYSYWLECIVGGGVIGITVDEVLGRRAGGLWRRLAVTSFAMTPPVAFFVVEVNHRMFGQPLLSMRFVQLLWQVWVISLAVMA
ncbi:MAG: hypothetical protein ACREEB_09855, partial [Caulobacteraceae bacterium]